MKLKTKILKLGSHLKALWVAETPRFWFNVQRLLFALSVSAGIGLSQLQNLPKWQWLPEILRICIFLGLVGTFLAQFTSAGNTPNANQTPPSHP